MRNRGVILRFARESDKKKQEPCQFARNHEKATILSQAKASNPAIKGVSLTDLAHTCRTRGTYQVLPTHQRSRKRCDDFKFITFSASILPTK
jgi:hypothetical protein